MSIEFTRAQKDAILKAERWLADGNEQVFKVFGYAGVGKSTVASALVEEMDVNPVYAAFTGKAAMVMRKAGCEDAATIHSTIYDTNIDRVTGKATFTLTEGGAIKDADIAVIDECSMVDGELARDLKSFGKPILVLGDPAQLPPVVDSRKPIEDQAGYFIRGEPDVMLTEIHRQAQDNPIVNMAWRVREGHVLEEGKYGESLVVRRNLIDEDKYANLVLKSDQVLCGKRDTRRLANAWVRRKIGRDTVLPQVGDRLICSRNDKDLGIFNGMAIDVVGDVAQKGDYLAFRVETPDQPDRQPFDVSCHVKCFVGDIQSVDWRDLRGTQQFEFAYALTVHKAQGSQWGSVLIRDESQVFREDARRWLYTAVTRAAERVVIIR